jgi:hypothetical protein
MNSLRIRIPFLAPGLGARQRNCEMARAALICSFPQLSSYAFLPPLYARGITAPPVGTANRGDLALKFHVKLLLHRMFFEPALFYLGGSYIWFRHSVRACHFGQNFYPHNATA